MKGHWTVSLKRPHLQELSAGAQVVTLGSIVQHPLDGLDLQLGVLTETESLTPQSQRSRPHSSTACYTRRSVCWSFPSVGQLLYKGSDLDQRDTQLIKVVINYLESQCCGLISWLSDQ